MKKTLLVLLFACSIVSFQSNGQTILFEDFAGVTPPNLPTGWTNTFTAVAGTTPHGWETITAAADAFFSYAGTPPRPQYVECTEYYNTGNHPADLTSPSFSLAGTTAPRLNFDFLFNGTHYYSGGFGYFEEGYIKLSTDGGTTWDYLDTLPVGGYWDHRSIDLSAYIGAPDCRISFEYTDSGGTLFGFLLTNVKVYNQVPYELGLISINPAPSAANFASTTTGINLGGIVTNYGFNTITDFTATYEAWASVPSTSTFSGLSIAPGESYSFTCATPCVPFVLDSVPVLMYISTAGDTTTNDDTLITGVTGVTHFPLKRPVAEEATATWCNTCPYGIIALDSFRKVKHDSISLIAVHCSISTIDPMEDGWYYGWMMAQIPQTPYMLFDRKYKTTPDQVSYLYDQHHLDFAYADISMGFVLNTADSMATVSVYVTPATNLHGTYRLALVLTEDYVHSDVTPSSWDQTNVYSGGSSSGVTDAEYNFNTLPNPVPATYMYYNNVDRRVFPNVYGGLYFPTPMAAGTSYPYTFNVPYYTWKTANMHAIAMLIDSTTGYIINSGNVAFGPDTMTIPPIPLAVNSGLSSSEKITLSPNPATTSLTISAIYPITSVEICDVLGQVVLSDKFNSPQVQVNVASLPAGAYFAKINNAETRKFVKQ